MTLGPMRKLTAPTTISTKVLSWQHPLRSSTVLPHYEPTYPTLPTYSKRYLAQIRPDSLDNLWFTPSVPQRTSPPLFQNLNSVNPPDPNSDHKPPSKRTVQLGKTLRKLSPLLPTLLTTPLPNSLLSSSVTLHLFPSTHRHLPIVKGPLAYRAALFTAPVAWGTVPLVGNCKLDILSEKIVRTGFQLSELAASAAAEEGDDVGEEKLVVRWRTCPKAQPSNNGIGKGEKDPDAAAILSTSNGRSTNRGLSTLLGGKQPLFKQSSTPFHGLFIFTFNSDGLISSTTIEHADENSGFDKTSKVVTLTDWLLGKAKLRNGKEEELVPGLAIRALVRDEQAQHARSRGLDSRAGKSHRLW